MNKIEKYENLIDKFKKVKPIAKREKKLNVLYNLQKELLDINERVEEWLNKDEIFFNISSKNDINLVYSIFHNKHQYTFGDERYHYYHIKINKRGLIKLEKMIKKVQSEINNLESQV